MTQTIDLRSDTVTRPCAAMRRAIAAAEVGDDVWGEDPTVIALQERTADLLGKEAALYVPSGTMANQIALQVHTRPGDEVLLGWGSHCVAFESGAGAALAGVQFKILDGDGLFSVEQVGAAIQSSPDVHFAPTTLVWMENTHNRGGGLVFPHEQVIDISRLARERGLATHVDGARLFHASEASRISMAELVAPADSTSICLSKGLGAPVGSVLAGTADFITSARRYRKMLGGAMRQAGILAAAGIFALENNVQRLAQDHENARLLADGLAEIRGLTVDPDRVMTNIVIFSCSPDVMGADALIQTCADQGLRFAAIDHERFRLVTHKDVSTADCQRAVQILARTLA